MMLTAPLDGSAAEPTEAQIEEEGAAFMAAMQQAKG
jgi:hypothetical protein